jgi:hypothetical protein
MIVEENEELTRKKEQQILKLLRQIEYLKGNINLPLEEIKAINEE